MSGPVFIVHADNWAQIPKLTPLKSGSRSIGDAIKQAIRVLKTGDNNAEDTIRVYRRPTTERMLRRDEALAYVRRAPNGRSIEVKMHAHLVR